MDCTIHVAKTKALISFAVTAKLICVFVFAYAKSWFSHDAAHFYLQIDRWPHNGYVKKLQRKGDGYWYYYNKTRELLDKDLQKCKLYVY